MLAHLAAARSTPWGCPWQVPLFTPAASPALQYSGFPEPPCRASGCDSQDGPSPSPASHYMFSSPVTECGSWTPAPCPSLSEAQAFPEGPAAGPRRSFSAILRIAGLHATRTTTKNATVMESSGKTRTAPGERRLRRWDGSVPCQMLTQRPRPG